MKNTISLFVILLFLANQILAQNNAPEVNNVTFSQRTDGSFIVDVYYDLNDVDGDTMFVTMQVSEDSGATWSFSCDSISGNIIRRGQTYSMGLWRRTPANLWRCF